MQVVMCACNEAAPRYAPTRATRCTKCGVELQVVLTVDENKERLHRGVTLAQWFAAPKTPETRAECKNGERPCPYLRCKYQLGAPGAFGCALDETENEPTAPLAGEKMHHSLDYIAGKLGCERERVRQIERSGLVTLRRRRRELGR